MTTAPSSETAPSAPDLRRPSTVEVLRRIWTANQDKSIGLVAAGIAFYALLAMFPGITALIAIGGLIMDPDLIADELARATGLLPDAAARILTTQATQVAGADVSGLTIAATVGVAVALFSSSRGVANLIKGLNIAQERAETRGFIRLTLMTFVLTVMVVIWSLLAVGAVILLPVTLRLIEFLLPGGTGMGLAVAGALRWPVLIALVVLGLSAIYRLGPAPRVGAPRDDRRGHSTRRLRRWISPGAAIATALWLPGSVAFTIYVGTFGTYAQTFGALGGVVILLLWFWLSAYLILLGAVIDHARKPQAPNDPAGPVLGGGGGDGRPHA